MPNTTWNPADRTNITLSGGNLIAVVGAGSGGVRGVHSKSAGKHYVEYTYTTINTNSFATGIALSTASLTTPTTGAAIIVRLTGAIFVNNAGSGSSLGVINPAAIIGVAVDFSAQLIWFRKSPAGSWNGSGTADPATGAGGVSISSIAGALYPCMGGQTSDRVTANFGDTAFSGAAPSGYTAGWPDAGAAVAQQYAVTVVT